jgi:hypothetical protein
MPHTPQGVGYRLTDTSQAAGARIEGKAGALRAAVLQALRNAAQPMTADEVAVILREDKLSIRPRFTELRNAGKILDSGERGRTDSGSTCIKWRLADV